MEEVTGIIPPPDIALEATGKAPGRGRLIGKHILVVGGGQSVNDFDPNPPIGNGRAACILLAREGATVVVADRSREAAQGTVDLIVEEGIGSAHLVVGDVATPEGCSGIVQDALKLLDGILDGLVIGVGIVSPGPSVKPYSAEYWDIVMNINVRSHFLILQEACPYIEKRPTGGSVVSISSISQYLPASNEPAYNASKAALSVLIKNISFQFAPRVRVNTVVPGLIDTPMGRSAGTTIKGRNASAVPLSRQGTGWDIGYAIVFLMSGESSYITAQDIVVDGGRVGMGNRGAKVPGGATGVS
ncbi:NAD(P)-binding protein [Lepidopterella palustris CBS 459.81]|uniref:NAD(P)-binding protein n=1 Tax=Lepidopterella palustris CBS 459.81 TaxID=1314670 RepID=A0A8E2JJI1_9PEZI|nr:NAD(P)-binding protein [Lepidopterella palustris CBS 459.81]